MFEDIRTHFHERKDEYNVDVITEDLLRLYKIKLRLNYLASRKKLPESITTKIIKPKYKRYMMKKIRDEFKDLVKPEETFEVWNQEDLMTYRVHSMDKIDDDYLIKVLDDSINDDFDDYDNRVVINLDNKLNQILSGKTTDQNTQDFLLRTKGFEIMPKATVTNSTRYHLHNLTFFLNMTILKEKWDLAYRIFSLIIRIPNVDIRNFWSLGVEILKNKSQTSNFELFNLKQQKFFSWLTSFYILKIGRPKLKSMAPLFKSGSKTQVPMYFMSSLWSLLSYQDYKRVIDNVESLILVSPYDLDGSLHFVLCISYLMDTTALAKSYMKSTLYERRDIYKNINSNFKAIEKFLGKCQQLNFEFPKDLVDAQIQYITDKLTKADNNDPEESDSDNDNDYDKDNDKDSSDESVLQLSDVNDDDEYSNNNDIYDKNDRQENNIDNTRKINSEFLGTPTILDDSKINDVQKISQDGASQVLIFSDDDLEPSQIPSDEEIEFDDEVKPSQIPSDEEIEFDDEVKPSQIPSDEEIMFSDDNDVEPSQIPSDEEIEFDDDVKPSQIPSDEEIEFDDEVKPSQIPSDEEIMFSDDIDEHRQVQVPKSSQIEELDFDFN